MTGWDVTITTVFQPKCGFLCLAKMKLVAFVDHLPGGTKRCCSCLALLPSLSVSLLKRSARKMQFSLLRSSDKPSKRRNVREVLSQYNAY